MRRDPTSQALSNHELKPRDDSGHRFELDCIEADSNSRVNSACGLLMNTAEEKYSMKTLMMMAILGISLHAQDDGGRRCSAATLKGSYGYIITGTRQIPGVPMQTEAAIGVGIRTFDGNGGFTQIDTTKGASAGAAVDVSTTGTYTVSPDCTGKYILIVPSLPNPIEVRFVIQDNAREIRWIVLHPQGTMVQGHAVRI